MLIDMSAELAHHMVRYPSPYLPDVTIEAAATHAVEARSAQIVRFGTHVSTHIDAPFHGVPGGRPIDQIPLDWLYGPTLILRFGDRDVSSPLDAPDFERFGDLSGWTRLVLDTGWAKRTWGTKTYFTEGPYLTRAAARLLAGLPALKCLGMDFPNVDAKPETVMGTPAPNHRILLEQDMCLLENLLRLDEVPDRFTLSAFPMRLVGGDGCPTRAVAIIE